MLRLDFLHVVAGACLIIVATFLAGAFYASLGQTPTVNLAPISGRVTFHGKPQPNLLIEFVPVAGGRGSEGCTDSQGHYQVIYTPEKVGALVGQQEAVISTPEVLDHHGNLVVPRKVLLSTDVDVHPGANQFNFDLASQLHANPASVDREKSSD
jgi:hypothetical protein